MELNKMKKPQFDVLSPDGFSIEMDSTYQTIEAAQTALDAFVERYKTQGYYSTIRGSTRFKIPISDIAFNCQIVKL